MKERIEDIDQRIKVMENEILDAKKKTISLKNTNQKENMKKRALFLLKKKKLYEHHRDQLMNQQFNLEQFQIAAESIKYCI